MCTCGVVCGVGGGVCCFVVVVRVCVVCGEAWQTLSLLLSLLALLFPFRFLFLALSYLYFSLLFFFFFFFFSCSFSYSCSCSSLSSMERTDQPTRRPPSRHLNVIWRRASAQQSVLSLLLSPPTSLLSLSSSKKRGTFLQEYFRRGNYFTLQF